VKGLACWPLALAACAGVEGTFDLALVTAPGSTVLDDVTHARLTLSNPRSVVEADRGSDGKFQLSLDVPALGVLGDLTFEGFDASGARLAYGRTPALPVAAIDSAIAIYVAAPGTLASAPVELDPPRRDVGTAAFPFGVVVAGGLAADEPTDDVAVYNVYTHAWQLGVPLPAPRAALTIGPSASGFAYLVGGVDDDGADTGTLWRFDTTAPPTTTGGPGGSFAILDDEPTLARRGAAIALVASEGLLVPGAPPGVVDGITGTLTAATTVPRLAGTATTVTAAVDGADALFAVFIGEGSGASGLVRVAASGSTDEPDVPASARRTGHGSVPTADGRVIALGGAVAGVLTASALVASPATRSYVEVAGVLATPRTGAAIAASNGLIVVAGGTDAGGAVVTDAEIIDVATLTRVATVPLVVPRTGAVARPLANGQVLILGGVDASGAAIATVELFTPDP